MVDVAGALGDVVRAGDTIVVGNGTSEPTGLISALIAVARDFDEPIRVIQITTSGREQLAAASGRGIRLATPSPGQKTREAIEAGRAELMAVSLGQLAKLIESRTLKVDGVLLQVGPEESGYAYPGLTMDLGQPAFEHARYRFVEVNSRLPRVKSRQRIKLSDCNLAIPVDVEPTPERERKPFAEGAALAENIAACIPGGATLEIGIGRVGGLLPAALKGRHGFSIYSGMIGDETMALIEAGIVDRPPRSDIEALASAAVMRGSARFYQWCDGNGAIAMDDARRTHDPAFLAGCRQFTALNTGLQVDLFGNVNSVSIGGRLRGGIGGAFDYAVAGCYAGGSIVAIESRHNGRSSIVGQVERVTLPGACVTHVVTETGVARLRGLSVADRALAIASIAAPEFREELTSRAKRLEGA